MKIYSRWNLDEVIYTSKEKTKIKVLEEAAKNGANLSRADLYGADLSRADLYGADLSRADLYGADLSGANLSRADLYGANLSGANLSGANLSGADLSGANLSGAENYSENHCFGIEICKRLHEKFTQKEGYFVFEFLATSPCWDTIKERFGKTALSVFKKLKDAGWGEYYDRFKPMINGK